jgi:pimeloyl-ACP methyl ester carboxylesterase
MNHATSGKMIMKTIWIELLGAKVNYYGHKLRTRVLEAGEGAPLILIHGIGGHAEAYSRNLVRLGKNFHALAIDLVWHGLSAKPPFNPAALDVYCEQLLELMDTLGLERASIEGESLGGWITMWMALNHPDRLERIVLNTTAGVTFASGSVQERPHEGIELLRERSLAAISNPTRDTVRKRLEWLMASPDRVTEELIELRHAFYSDAETQKALYAVFDNAFSKGGLFTRYGLKEERLAEIKVPALVLWSDKNPGNGPDAGQRIASLIPGAQFYCINDAAHWPQWEKPEEHDRVVTAFLKGERVG